MSEQITDLLIVDDHPDQVKEVQAVCKQMNWSCLVAKTFDEALYRLEHEQFRAALMELTLAGLSSLQILEWVKTLPSSPEIIIVSSEASVDMAVKALKLGAFDYLKKPYTNTEQVSFCIKRAIETYNLLHRLESFQEGQTEGSFESIIGKSLKMQAIYEMIRNIAPSDSNILVLGESGTGKELVAKAIHRNSYRAQKPFVVINCAAMPETLFEAELFGSAKGAYTGSVHDKTGLFESADGGTVFLDEIGEIPLSTQVKLLRVLQEGEVKRLGEVESRQIDVRVIAATHKNLGKLIEQGLFREDLFYRLNVISVNLPSLFERLEDIPLLAYHFLREFSKKMNKEISRISTDTLQALQGYKWPGNIRELENVIERAVVLATGDTITAKNLPPKILSSSFYNVPLNDENLVNLDYKEAKKRALNIFNRSYIMGLLEKTSGNITAASEMAGLDRSNFKKIIRRYVPKQVGLSKKH